MTRKVNQALWDQWRRRIERQRSSGLSIAEFCRREDVSQASFHTWKRKLRNSRSAPPSSQETATQQASHGRRAGASRRPAARSSPPSPAAPTRSPSFLQLPVSGTRSSPWIELTLVDGTVIRVPQQNLAALQTVLRVLRGGEAETLVGEGEVSHA
jgi:transposase-like protein